MNVERLDLGTRLVDFAEAWDHQRAVHADVVAGRREDTVLLVEHAPVYTAGRRTTAADRPAGVEIVDVDRGGRITWHGPGQLVAYPIVRLPEPVDVVDHVRRLERAVMAVCADLGVVTEQVSGRSGVWLPGDGPPRKVAAVGVRVASGVTMHGLALNCDADLTAYDRIVACGLPDAAATSLTREAGRPVTVLEAAPLLATHLREQLTRVRVAG